VFERLSEHGRQVIVLAQDEARSLGHEKLGSEHILLGLLRLDDELVELFGDPADLRARVVELVGYGESAVTGQIEFTANAVACVKQAAASAATSTVGPLELALALLSLPETATASRALRAHGVPAAAARDEILALGGDAPLPDDRPAGLGPVTLRVLETAARHAEDVPVAAEHILLALVLEVPDLASRTIGIADGGLVQERLAGLLDGPERPRAAAGGQDIAILEAALRNAEEAGAEEVSPQHLLLGLLEVAPGVVARAAVDLAAIEGTVRAWRVPKDDEPTGALHRFSPAARDAITRALDEARLLDHAYVGTEHLLLGLIQDEHGAAGRVLADLHIPLSEARIHTERIAPRGDRPAPAGPLPFTARAKRVLSLALHESFRSDRIDTGHLLLGIERDGDGVAVLVLARLGASRDLVRRCTLAMLGHDPVPTPAPSTPPSIGSAFAGAGEEAAALGQPWVGCEHLLLALIRRGGRVAAALAGLGVALDHVLWGVIELGGVDRQAEPFLTARLVRAVRTAQRLAEDAGRPQPDERDLILGLARESIGAARELLGRAADEAALRRALREP
jgi:ATP-dependent Clp protease ATP-binding subunit ClpA